MSVLPKPADVVREAVTVVAGALLAAWVVGKVPAVRDWIKRQWGGALPPG